MSADALCAGTARFDTDVVPAQSWRSFGEDSAADAELIASPAFGVVQRRVRAAQR